MSIFKTIVNHDEMFRLSSRPPLIINDLRNMTDEDRKTNNALIFQELNGTFDSTPRCGCGHLRNERRLGQVCNICNTPVRDNLETKLESQLWMRPPKGIGVNVFLNPGIWQLLSEFFTLAKKREDKYTVTTTRQVRKPKEGFNPLMWITCTDYHPKGSEALIAELELENIPRGYSNFIKNFDSIINTMFSMRLFKNKPETKIKELIDIINRADSQGALFCHHLPLMDRTLIAIENEGSYRYIEPSARLAVDAARQLLGVDVPGQELRLSSRENRTAKAIAAIAKFTIGYAKDNISSKTGLVREQIFASRTGVAGRAVITSVTKSHRYDELFAPWSVAVGFLRVHIQNYLMKLGFTPLEMNDFLSYVTTNYHPLVDWIFRDLIAKSPDKALPGLFIRNPSFA